jgi:hypothetical protein
MRSVPVVALMGLALSSCSSLPSSVSLPDVKVPEFFPQSPDAGPEATAPVTLKVPPGNKLTMVLVGSGYQDYQCVDKEGVPTWSLTGPEATLYDSDTKQAGTHSPGPTWKYKDGSVVHGKVVAQAPSVAPSSIPQLLLAATSEAADGGAFAGLSYIQRLRTVGGLPPDYGCDAVHLGAKLGKQYSAFYLFYKPA